MDNPLDDLELPADGEVLPFHFRSLDKAEAWILANGGHRIGVGSSQDPEFPTKHHFTPGLYVRELHLPAGSVNVSKIHKTEHPYVILSGRVSVYSDNDGVQHLIGPCFGITRVGSRRLVVAHEDTVWLTFHPTELTDIDKIEEMIIELYPCDFPITTKLRHLEG